MQVNIAEDKALKKAEDFAHKTNKEEEFWKMLFSDIERKERLIELDRIRDDFDND